MDVLDDILASLRLNGGVVFDTSSRGDWCVISQFQPEHCARYFPVPERIIAYHYVRSGRIHAQLQGGETVALDEGAMVLFPRNDPHLLFTRHGLAPTDIDEYIRPGASGAMNRIVMDFGGESHACYCGWLGVLSGDHPLLHALPPMLVVGPDEISADWITSSLRIAAGEWKDSPNMVAKISELFFAKAVRAYVAGLDDSHAGWLSGLRDPAVARALAVIHSRFAEDLDVEAIAREAGVSRTVLGQRFADTMGEPPMRYCTRWRMRVAANRLLDGRDIAAVSHHVGFSSEAAFNRAFKREYGEPPGLWKRRVGEGARLAAELHQVAA